MRMSRSMASIPCVCRMVLEVELSFLSLDMLDFKEVEEAIRRVTALKERQKLRETQIKLQAAIKEVEEARQQDEVLRKRLHEDVCPVFFFNLLLDRRAVSDFSFLEIKKGIEGVASEIGAIATVRDMSEKRRFREGELEALMRSWKPLRKAIIECFKEMARYLEGFEG